MAMDYYEDKNFSKAIPYFENIINYYPIEKGKYYAFLSSCHMELNNKAQGIEYFCKAEQIILGNSQIQNLKIKLKQKYGQKIDCNN